MDINPQKTIELKRNLRAPGLNHRRIALDKLAKYPSEIAVPILEINNRFSDHENCGSRSFRILDEGCHH